MIRAAIAGVLIWLAVLDWFAFFTIWHHPGVVHVAHHLGVTAVCLALAVFVVTLKTEEDA